MRKLAGITYTMGIEIPSVGLKVEMVNGDQRLTARVIAKAREKLEEIVAEELGVSIKDLRRDCGCSGS